MQFKFDKLVESLLNEISQPNPPVSDPSWRTSSHTNPQAGHGDPSAGSRHAERNQGLEKVAVSVKVTWAGSGRQDWLKNPTTKETISFDASKKGMWIDKLDRLKASGKITDYKFVERLA